MSRNSFLLLLFCLFSCLLVSGRSLDAAEGAKPATDPPALAVEVITVRKEPFPIWLEFTGRSAASNHVEVRARVTGTLEKAFFKEGAMVTQGTPLMQIEKAVYQDALDQAVARRKRDQATLNLAMANVKRFEPLVAEGLAPRLTLEEYQARANELRATVEAGDAAIRSARLDLDYTTVRAPITGRIGRLLVDAGNMVGFGEKTVLTTMIADDPLYVYFSPTEEEFQIIRQLASVKKLPARVRVPDRYKRFERADFSGTVDFTDNRVNEKTGTVTMRASVANPEHRLMEGTFVYIDLFVTDQLALMMIPSHIVLEDQQGSFVYAVDNDNRVIRKNIERGFEGRDFLEVKTGLDDGTRVIISALTRLRPQIPVTARDVTADKGPAALIRENGKEQ